MPDLFTFVLVPILAGIVGYLLPERMLRVLTLLFQMVFTIGAGRLFFRVQQQGAWSEVPGGFTGSLGVVLSVDRLSALLILLTAVLFLLFMLYNLSQDYTRKLFFALFLVLEGLLIGIFLSGDLFNVYVLVEVATVVVTFLILFKQGSRSPYDGLVYLMINMMGMTFFLFGLGMLYRIFGVVDFHSIAERMPRIENAGVLVLPYSLMITGISLKAAFFPLSAWLPRAHGTPGAPTVMSALLSGLYIKMGIYLFIRVQALFSSQIDTSDFFVGVGLLTGFAGIFFALRETDIKRFFGFSTVSQLGLILIGVSQGEGNAYWGGVYHIVNHSLFKSTLFLASGLLIDVYGTRDMNKIRGVLHRMPLVSAAVVMAILGVTGAPLFNGSISKEMIKGGFSGSFLHYALILINLGTAVYAIRFLTLMTGERDKKAVRIPRTRQMVIVIMGMGCLFGGLFGSWIVEILFSVQLQYDWTHVLVILLWYLGTLVVAWMIHRVLPRPTDAGRVPWIMRWDFNQMVVSVGFFFGFVMLYVGIRMSLI